MKCDAPIFGNDIIDNRFKFRTNLPQGLSILLLCAIKIEDIERMHFINPVEVGNGCANALISSSPRKLTYLF